MRKFFAKLKLISPLYYIAVGIFFVASIIFSFVFMYQPVTVSQDDYKEIYKENIEIDQDCKYKRFVDGVCVYDESDMDSQLVGVMIENHIDAKPISGLTSASVVYEAPVEANYPRFLAIFVSDISVTKAGPVRSVRPYFIDWVSEYHGIMYMYVGGSPDALQKIKNVDVFDLNEFYRGWYYWRDQARYAPHNVYTSSVLWNKALEDYDIQDTDDKPEITDKQFWKFNHWDDCVVQCVHGVIITFSGKTYETEWKYNTSTKQYERYEYGKIVRDSETGDMVVADTIVVQYVGTRVIDSIGRLSMDTIGTGNAIIFRDGFKIEGEWRKMSRTDRTRFYYFDQENQEIPFRAGKIWVEMVNRADGVSFE